MSDDELEFTEEDMFSHLDGAPQENQSSKANLVGTPVGTEPGKAEKAKRPRSAVPEAHPSNNPSPENFTLSRQDSDPLNPVTAHFSQQGASGTPSQTMKINKARETVTRDSQADEPDEETRQLKKMGTSMPITIPGMEKAMLKKRTSAQADAKPTTFVPPHMLEQPNVDSRPQSLNSGSIAKRDRLLQRNKILRRTGFLEAGGLDAENSSGGLPELMDPLNRRLMPIKESYKEHSALSAALGTPRKD